MVGRAKRAAGNQALRRVEQAGHTVHLGCLDRFLKGQPRQDGSQALGEHRLARARRTDHEDVMGPRSRHLQRPLCRGLSANIVEIHAGAGFLFQQRLGIQP